VDKQQLTLFDYNSYVLRLGFEPASPQVLPSWHSATGSAGAENAAPMQQSLRS
jgi:hypothetical protein